jgi:hypothetical protein
MILEDITTEFSTLPDDEALKLIMSIRANRRVSKKPVVAKNKTKQPKETTVNMDAISPQMAAMLLQRLKETK